MAASTALREQQLTRLVDGLRRYGAQKIILFGSAARGTAEDCSDLDIVVVTSTTRSFVDRLADVVPFIPRDLPAVDVLVYTPEEYSQMIAEGSPFLSQVVAEGKVLYEA